MKGASSDSKSSVKEGSRRTPSEDFDDKGLNITKL